MGGLFVYSAQPKGDGDKLRQRQTMSGSVISSVCLKEGHYYLYLLRLGKCDGAFTKWRHDGLVINSCSNPQPVGKYLSS